MASEGSLNITLSSSRGNTAVNFSESTKFDIAADPSNQDVVNCSSAGWNAIPVGSIADPPQKIAIKNLDPTNYIEVALTAATTYRFAKLKPGQVMAWEPAVTGSIYWKANGADCKAKIALVSA